MMDTLLNVGLCDATVGGMLRQTGNPRLVWDTYRRLVASYGEAVAGLSAQTFEAQYLALAGTRDEHSLDFAELRELTQRCLAAYQRAAGQPFPQDPQAHLAGAIGAVLASWQSPRASAYRKQCGVSDAIGTAVTVQAMVFGNGGGRSGAGVGFTRNPITGEPALWVDFLFNAQGEDVVSGRRSAGGHQELSRAMPDVWVALCDAAARLERGFGDMQDFEFTVQDARLYMLQARGGKRTPQAAARIALDLLDAGLIDIETARNRTAALHAAALVSTHIVAPDGKQPDALGHAASAGAGVAVGEIAFDQARVSLRTAAGASVILVRRDALTDDIAALERAAGLLTQRGARTSHAAVVARQLGKVCLVGCAQLHIDDAARTLRIGDTLMHEGEVLTLDGNDGAIYAGAVRTVARPLTQLQARLERLRAP
jgi:pyruvate,orthophosphate dikinase